VNVLIGRGAGLSSSRSLYGNTAAGCCCQWYGCPVAGWMLGGTMQYLLTCRSMPSGSRVLVSGPAGRW
jgi:hypothetical protein